MSDNEVVGKIKIELAGNEQVSAKLKALRDEQKRLLDTIAQTAKQYGAESDQAKQAKKAAFDVTQKLSIEERRFAAEVKKANEELKAQEKFAKNAGAAAAEAASKARAASSAPSVTVSGTTTTSGRGTAISAAAQNAGQAIGSVAAGDIGGAVQNLAQAGAEATPALAAAGVSIATMTAAALIAAPAVIGVGIAVRSFLGYIQDGQQGVENGIVTLNNYFSAQALTTTQIKEQIKLREQEASANEGIKKVLEESIALARSQGIPDVANPAVAQLEELQKKLNTGYSALLGLNDALGSTAVAANDAAEALKKAQAEQIKALDERAQREMRDASLIRNVREGSTAALKETIAKLSDQIHAASNELFELQSIANPTEETTARIAELKKQITDLSRDSYHLSQNIYPVVDAREQEAVALRKQKEALQDAIKSADEFAANSRKIADVEKSRATQLEDRARTDSRNAQVSALESQIAAAKELEAQEQKSQKIVSLRKKAGEDEADAVRKYGDELRKANADYMAESLKALASFQLEQSRSEEDYARERIRKLQDLQSSLSELAAKGDVSSFISTQRSGVRDLQRGDEDFGVESRRRLEDFRLENEERIRQRDERLRELQNGFVAERSARQANLQEQIAQEQEQGKQRILRSAELEKQLSDLREQFAIEDVARQRAVEDAAFAEQMKVLRDRQKEIGNQITKFADPVITAGKKLFDDTSKAIVDAYARIRAAASGRTSVGGSAKMHDVGALYTQPTTLLSSFAEKPGRGDFVLPFNTNEGWRPMMERLLAQGGGGSSGGGSVVVNITTGDVATASQVEAVKQGVIQAVRMARQGI